MRIARVFCRRTSATPTDALAFVAEPPPLWMPEIDEVHVCVVFTWDMPEAERLAKQWEVLGVPVKLGGPAFRQPGGDFEPGLYVREGYVITSRGCPNHCWFCAVPAREGGLRELPIREGWNVLDDNLLACSEAHVRAVFAMLAQQMERPVFTGGLEARILRPWHCELLRNVKPKRMYFAFDTPDDYEPLVAAGEMLREAGFTIASHVMSCYVLIGWRGDTFKDAEKRLLDTIRAGFVPYAMLYRDETSKVDLQWQQFQREWLRPQIVGKKMKEVIGHGKENP